MIRIPPLTHTHAPLLIRQGGAGVGDSATTCGMCARPRDTKYRRISIPSDATGPQEPYGVDARPPGGAGAHITGGCSEIQGFLDIVLLRKDAPISWRPRVRFSDQESGFIFLHRIMSARQK